MKFTNKNPGEQIQLTVYKGLIDEAEFIMFAGYMSEGVFLRSEEAYFFARSEEAIAAAVPSGYFTPLDRLPGEEDPHLFRVYV